MAVTGCFTLSTPDYVLKHRDQIEKQLDVKVDVSRASSFTGNVDRVLTDIEKQLAPLPQAYRKKISGITIRDGFFKDYLLLAPLVGGYTANDGTVNIRNANATGLVQSMVLLPRGDTLIHEAAHSVQYYEIRRQQRTGSFSPEFGRFIRDWEYQYLGDVNGDGELDDRDSAWVAERVDQFDCNKDGNVDFRDVELVAGKPYVEGRWASSRGIRLLLRMSFEGIIRRTRGFANSYAQTYVWEDAAETMRYAWNAGYLPTLYSGKADAKAASKAWAAYWKLKKQDPLFARKVFLVLQYVAAHEQKEALSVAWLDYTRSHAKIAEAGVSRQTKAE